MSFSSLVTYLVTRSFNLPVHHLGQLLSNLTLATSNGFPTALMNTFVSPTGNNQQPTLLLPPASDLTLNSTPDHVLVHLDHLPYDLVLHLVHLLVPDLLNNINHFPNNLQKQYYHHRQKLRPKILLPVSFLVHVGVHLSDLLLQHVHLLLHHLPVRHHPNNIHNLPN